jgi:hypothetical protein
MTCHTKSSFVVSPRKMKIVTVIDSRSTGNIEVIGAGLSPKLGLAFDEGLQETRQVV